MAMISGFIVRVLKPPQLSRVVVRHPTKGSRPALAYLRRARGRSEVSPVILELVPIIS